MGINSQYLLVGNFSLARVAKQCRKAFKKILPTQIRMEVYKPFNKVDDKPTEIVNQQRNYGSIAINFREKIDFFHSLTCRIIRDVIILKSLCRLGWVILLFKKIRKLESSEVKSEWRQLPKESRKLWSEPGKVFPSLLERVGRVTFKSSNSVREEKPMGEGPLAFLKNVMIWRNKS